MGAVDVHWTWVLKGHPTALWPWVADTDFINRAAGLDAVAYAWEALPDGGRQRVATSRFGPLTTRWVEHPFAWCEGEVLSVSRDFLGGPLRSYRSEVRLTLSAEGLTLVQHSIGMVPRLGLLAPPLRWILSTLRRGFERAYRAAEAAALAEVAGEALGKPHPGALAALVGQGVAPALAKRLAAYLVHGPDRQVEALRPFALAEAWSYPREAVLAACFAALRAGLLEARWALRCPHCRGAKATVSKLEDLAQEAFCEDCALRFGASLDQQAELTFRPLPTLRPPLTALYCLAGPAATRHIVAQGVLASGAHQVVGLAARPGAYRLWAEQAAVAELWHDPQGPEAVAGVYDLAAAQPGPHSGRSSPAVWTHPGPESQSSAWLQGRTGGPRLAVALANLGDTPLAYRITALAEADPSCSVLEAMAHPDFPRSLPGVGLAPGVAHEVQVITVLAWRGEAPPADLAPASGAMVVSGPNQEPLWAFYEPLAAIQAALRHAHPLHGGALARGSGTLMGVAGAVPQLRGLAVDAVGEGLVLAAGGAWMLSPDLAMREELRLHMMLAAWTELGEDPAGWVAFAPQAPPEVGDAMLMPLSP